MIIELDDLSKDPPYVQVQIAISRAIATGELTEGTKLPTIRQLAGDLGLSNNTIARAYRELEHAGLVTSRGRRGTVVNAVSSDSGAAADLLVDDFVAKTRELGLDAATTIRLLAEKLARA